ncbi:MAG: rhomboid family intramembrane serine protease [Alphaproteobacteria bacterium]|nr:rhomboid family intramembrane serine protease [Alphaproteobacteria bacterium]
MGKLQRQVGSLQRSAASAARTVGGLFGLLWALELVDVLLLGGALDQFGVRPRSISGLWGILFAPFLHGGLAHLLANTVAGVPLAFLTMTRKRMDFWVVSVVAAITAGLGAWLFGAPGSVHIGASGVIFGYLGFLLGRGVFERRLGAALMSALVAFLYGGMIVGVLPGLFPGVSWQSHLFGFLGGLLVSRALGEGLRGKGR